MSQASLPLVSAKTTPTPIEKTEYLTGFIGELSGLLDQIIGQPNSENVIGTVGLRTGERISRDAPSLRQRPSPRDVARLIANLRTEVGGHFEIVSVSASEIVLATGCCPFGRNAVGRPALCMMTTNVLGRIVADRTGYARVVLDSTIAQGAPRCRVRISLEMDRSAFEEGHEFFAD